MTDEQKIRRALAEHDVAFELAARDNVYAALGLAARDCKLPGILVNEAIDALTDVMAVIVAMASAGALVDLTDIPDRVAERLRARINELVLDEATAGGGHA